MKIFLIILFVIAGMVNSAVSQKEITGNNAVRLLNNVPVAYQLNVNRPYIEIETEIPKRNRYSVSIYPSGGEGYSDFPVYAQFGLSKKLCMLGSIDVYTTSYSLTGNKFNGLGDAYIGLSYEFQKSKVLKNFIQPTVKIPTASFSDHMGTGKFDFDLGLGQSLVYNEFYNDLTVDMNFLNPVDYPDINSGAIPHGLYHVLDSLKNSIDNGVEPVLNLSVSPTYYFTDNLCIEGGATFTRNTKLNFNLSYFSGDLDYTFKKFEVYSGITFYHYYPVNYDLSELNESVTYNMSDKISFGLSASIGIHNYTGVLLSSEIDFAN
jgi:predicted small secreted protein